MLPPCFDFSPPSHLIKFWGAPPHVRNTCAVGNPIIFFNTLTTKRMSWKNIVYNLLRALSSFAIKREICFLLHNALMWSKHSIKLFSQTHFQKIVDDENKLLALLHDLTVQLSTNIFWISSSRPVRFTVPVVRQNS